jgi:hypothetical protein
MCDPELWPGGEAAPNCQTTPYRYNAKSWTAYVLDSRDLAVFNIQEAAALHMCISTPALIEMGCKNLVEPYFRELEKGE